MTEQNVQKQPSYIQMNKRTTAELLEIWQKNDQEAWTEDAFAVVQAILRQRVGNIPARGSHTPDGKGREAAEETTSEANALLRIAFWANRLAWPLLGIAIAMFAFRLVIEVQQLSRSPFSGLSLLLAVVNASYSLLTGAFYFISLKAIAAGFHLFADRNKQ